MYDMVPHIAPVSRRYGRTPSEASIDDSILAGMIFGTSSEQGGGDGIEAASISPKRGMGPN